MKVSLRRSFITLLLLFIPLQNFLDATNVGFSYSKDLTHDTVSVSASTHPGLILWALLALFLFWKLQRGEEKTGAVKAVSIWRRFWAFCIDFFFSTVALSPLLALLPLALEAQRTGHFEWQFGRDYSVPLDWLVWPVAILMLAALFLYFVYPLTKGRPTVGGYLMRLAPTQNGNAVSLPWPRAVKRTLWMMLGFCIWPYTLIKGKDSEGRTWYDRASGYQVMGYEKDKAKEKVLPLAWYFVFALAACGLAYGYTHTLSQGPAKPHWRNYAYGDYRLSVESPLYLPVDKPAYEEGKLGGDIVKGLAIDESSNGLEIVVQAEEFKKNVIPHFTDEYFKNFVKSAGADKRVMKFKAGSKLVTSPGLPAAFLSGTYLWDGEPFQFSSLVAANENWVWLIRVQGPEKAGQDEAINRVIQSFKIQK